jgi:ketosteroid isomerase-like protein
MNPAVQFLPNSRFSVLIITVLCVWPWCVKAIRNYALRAVHVFMDVIFGLSTVPASVRAKTSTSSVYLHGRPCLTFGRRRFGHRPRVKARKGRKIRDGRRRQSVIMRRKGQAARMRGRHFRNLFFIPPILFALFSSEPQANAQQAGPAQTSQLSDKQAFQQIEDRWSQAIAKRDQYALELLLSPELIDISASGDETTRNQQIAMLFEKGAEPLSLDRSVINVRRFGDFAVVIGTYDEQSRVNGKLVRQKGKFTHVYENVHNNWLCVSAQCTAEVGPASQKSVKRDKQNYAEHLIASACGSVL